MTSPPKSINLWLTIALVFLLGLELGQLSLRMWNMLLSVNLPWGQGSATSPLFPHPVSPFSPESLAPHVSRPAVAVPAATASPPVLASTTPKYNGPLQLELKATARPALVLIGGAKCGSTDAYSYLVPRFDFGIGRDGQDRPAKEMWCMAREDHKSIVKCYKKMFAAEPAGKFTIDGTPSYMHLYDRHSQGGGNCEVVATNMVHAARDAAALALLRDPIKRSRSEYSWSFHANSGHFRPQLASNINDHLDVELDYLLTGPLKELLDLLLQPPDVVDSHKIFDAYRQLADGYHMWLAKKPERCQRVSQKPIRAVTSEAIPWCFTWPILLPSLYYPLLLQWRSQVFRPRGAAIVQSEAYYANRTILDQLFSMSPKGTPAKQSQGRNKQNYESDSDISPRNAERLKQFFELPNRRLRELLRMLPAEGIAVLPPVDTPGAWWQDA